MNRDEFMRQLAGLLSGLSDSERMEAIRYYNDYFDEAGPENEAKVIEELESPEKVARLIREEMKEGAEPNQSDETSGQSSENFTWKTTDAGTFAQQNDARFHDYSAEEQSWQTMPSSRPLRRSRRGVGRWALVVIVLVFASPLILGLGGGLLGGVFGILAGILGLIVGAFATAIGLIASGVGLIVDAIFSSPVNALVYGGGGLILIGCGILLLMLFGWLAFRIFPRFCRAIVTFVSRLWHRRKGAVAQ